MKLEDLNTKGVAALAKHLFDRDVDDEKIIRIQSQILELSEADPANPELLDGLKDLLASLETDPDEARTLRAATARLTRAAIVARIGATPGIDRDKLIAWSRNRIDELLKNQPERNAVLRAALHSGGPEDARELDAMDKEAELAGQPVATGTGSPGGGTPPPPSGGGGGSGGSGRPPSGFGGAGGGGVSDPTPLRDRLLQVAQINPAGMPAALRVRPGQETYIDAVIQGLELMGHAPRDADALKWAASAAGVLLHKGYTNPSDPKFYQHVQRVVSELSSSADEGAQIHIDGRDAMMFAPAPDSSQRIALFKMAWQDLGGGKSPLFLQSFAAAGHAVVDTYADHRDSPQLRQQIAEASYARHLREGTISADGKGGGDGVVDVSLPPLNDPHGYNDEIEKNNIEAVATIYVSYQMEFAFKACSRLLDLFVAGLLPINASDPGARLLDELYWDQEDLLDEATRRSIQSRVIGAPGGEIGFGMQPNTEFQTLLMRVVSAVSEYEREQNILIQFDRASAGRRVQSTSGEFVRKAVRDFAANVSLRGWAGTAFAAERMARHIRRVMKVLGLPAVRNALGVTTAWQVVERISQREFGITVNTVLHRTLAVETQAIMKIIADNHTIWSAATPRPLFSSPGVAGDLDPDTGLRLMRACQHFRAVTGVGDSLVHEYSEPVETQPMPSLPDFGSMGGMGGIGGGDGGMGMPGLNADGVAELRRMAQSGQTPSPEQIMQLLPGSA